MNTELLYAGLHLVCDPDHRPKGYQTDRHFAQTRFWCDACVIATVIALVLAELHSCIIYYSS